MKTASKLRRGATITVVSLAAVFFVLSISWLTLPEPRSSIALHPDNVGDNGTHALVTILEREGVDITVVDSIIAVQAAVDSDTTVVALNTVPMNESQRARLAELPATVVMGLEPTDITGALSGMVESSIEDVPDYVTAQCDDPDAQAAARISHAWGSLTPIAENGEVEICFPAADDATSGVLAIWHEHDYPRYGVAETELFTNQYLDHDGNAALALRLLGKHHHLIWYTALSDDEYTSLTFSPQWYRGFMWLGVVVILGLIWARAPRFGPVATEALPVVVKGGEIVRGVGRLYHHNRDHAHAAAALRAGSLTRLRNHLALDPTLSLDATLAAISQHTSYPEPTLRTLLAGPPPTSATALTDLATELAALERKVHLL